MSLSLIIVEIRNNKQKWMMWMEGGEGFKWQFHRIVYDQWAERLEK